jgi:hypothetical protein
MTFARLPGGSALNDSDHHRDRKGLVLRRARLSHLDPNAANAA